jgi:hypothetical protein
MLIRGNHNVRSRVKRRIMSADEGDILHFSTLLEFKSIPHMSGRRALRVHYTAAEKCSEQKQ